jgi:teichuronic acid biosynthesis glycosyltransferase TuaC
MIDLKSLEVSQEFPSSYYPIMGVMVKNCVDELSKMMSCEVLSPKAHVIPIPGFPFWKFSRLPKSYDEIDYTVHLPRYLYPVPKSWFYQYAGDFYARRIMRYAKNLQKPDVIHAHFSYPDGYACLKLKEMWHCPLIIHARGTKERLIPKTMPDVGKRIIAAYQSCDAVIANSFELKKDCINLGVPENKITVIPNGVNHRMFNPIDKDVARKALNLPLDKKIVLYVGMFREVKGTQVLVPAIKDLLRKRKDVLCILIGSGDLDTFVKKALASEIQTGGVMLPGPKPQSEIPKWMNAADLFVLPSLSEARSNVIPEALACEVPVLASDVGGIPEIMRKSHGLLVEPSNAPAIVDGIDTLFSNMKKLKMMGKSGRKFVLAEGLTWEHHAQQTLKLYKSLVNKSVVKNDK